MRSFKYACILILRGSDFVNYKSLIYLYVVSEGSLYICIEICLYVCYAP